MSSPKSSSRLVKKEGDLPHLLGTNENELRLFYYYEESVPGGSLTVMWIRKEKK